MIHPIFERALVRRALLFGFAAATLGLSGCLAGGSSQMAWTGGENEPIEFDARGAALSRDLELLTTRHSRPEGKLVVQLEFFNRSHNDLTFEWKLDWYDQNGFLYDSPRGWVREVFGGRETRTLTGVAPNTQSVSWRLSARHPNVVR